MAPAAAQEQETQVGDLPEVCLAQVIALTSPRDTARCAAVSPTFRAAADSDDVWRTFLPTSLELDDDRKKKDTYLGLCDAGALVDADGNGCVMVWLGKATGARCYALPARRLSLPWDDGEFTWRWTTATPLSTTTSSRFPDVAELVADCACLDVYGRLPASALTPGTPYAAYLVYGTAEGGGHRGLSFPDQETTVAVGGRVVARHAVCLCPDAAAEARKFRAVVGVVAGGRGLAAADDVGSSPIRKPSLRGDGWCEMEMGQVMTCGGGAGDADEQEVVASFEVLGWGPKRGLIIEAIEFRPLR